MQYNLHPLFVHFPIALLVVYSCIKIIPFERWFSRVAWKDIQRALLFFGLLGASAALFTGETAEHLTQPNVGLVSMHSLFATIATSIYGALFAGELCAVFHQYIARTLSVRYMRIISLFEIIFVTSIYSRILAVCGFIALSITGVLGGVMVYGLSADPIAPLILSLLRISI
jgi:uncharacterized membrane protein